MTIKYRIVFSIALAVAFNGNLIEFSFCHDSDLRLKRDAEKIQGYLLSGHPFAPQGPNPEIKKIPNLPDGSPESRGFCEDPRDISEIS